MPVVSAATWPSSPTPRWPAGWTSSSCGTRVRPASSGSGRWRPATSWRRWQVLADAARRHGALLAVNDRADIARAAGADVLHLGQDDLPLAVARDIIGPRPLIGRSTHDPAQVAAAAAEEVRLLLRRPVLAHPDQAGPPRARPGPGPRRGRTSAPHKPWFAIGGIDAQRLPEVLAAGRPPDRGGAGDHRGRRSAGRGAAAASGARAVDQQRDRRRHGAQPLPAGGEAGMQRQLGHLVLGDPAQLGALPIGHRLQQLRCVGDDGGVGPMAAARGSAVTTLVRTVNCSAGRPASSWASRTAACSAVSWLSRAPPGRPQVPPWWLHGARCCSSTAAEPSGRGARSSSPAAPCRPQKAAPLSDITQPSPSPCTRSG